MLAVVLIITAISTVVGAFYWLTDTETYKVVKHISFREY